MKSMKIMATLAVSFSFAFGLVACAKEAEPIAEPAILASDNGGSGISDDGGAEATGTGGYFYSKDNPLMPEEVKAYEPPNQADYPKMGNEEIEFLGLVRENVVLVLYEFEIPEHNLYKNGQVDRQIPARKHLVAVELKAKDGKWVIIHTESSSDDL